MNPTVTTMHKEVRLIHELDSSRKTTDKLLALQRYFSEADPHSAAWLLWLLCGNKLPLRIPSRRLRHWAADLSGLPDWLVEECYERVGDLAETAALLFPLHSEAAAHSAPETLASLIEQRLLPLRDWDSGFQLQLLRQWLTELPREAVFIVCKLMTGGFRIGVSKALTLRALAQVTGIDSAVLTHRLMGDWQPHPDLLASLKDPQANAAALNARPFPFYLAAPLDGPPDHLGAIGNWQIEWKWDGFRAQLLVRDDDPQLWSRGDERLTEAFPEIISAAAALPRGCVLDGEILGWRDNAPLPFHVVQQRISRKQADATIQTQAPVAFIAYDLLELNGIDLRNRSTAERRQLLQQLVDALPPDPAMPIRLSPLIEAADWLQLQQLWQSSRERGVEGMMLKARAGTYKAGRVRGEWWKWKVDPLTADLVLMYAQAGHGRRSGWFTDYTLGAWIGGRLVPVAKAYSGLTDAEIRQLDRWIKQHTLARRGPVRTVPAEQVFEIGFEGVQPSSRHKSGIALRFPRILRWRRDKPADQADTVEQLAAMA